MSKEIKITSLIFMLVILVGYIVYISIFPLAEAIELPSLEDVKSIQIEKEGTRIDFTTEKEMKEIMNFFEESIPTRKVSVNDAPSVKDYYIVNFSTESNRMYRTYIYKENGKWYIEQAYVGIYKLKGNMEFILNKL